MATSILSRIIPGKDNIEKRKKVFEFLEKLKKSNTGYFRKLSNLISGKDVNDLDDSQFTNLLGEIKKINNLDEGKGSWNLFSNISKYVENENKIGFEKFNKEHPEILKKWTPYDVSNPNNSIHGVGITPSNFTHGKGGKKTKMRKSRRRIKKRVSLRRSGRRRKK